jgi:hypothetical protein
MLGQHIEQESLNFIVFLHSLSIGAFLFVSSKYICLASRSLLLYKHKLIIGLQIPISYGKHVLADPLQ